MSADDNLMIANVSRRRFLMGLAGGSALGLSLIHLLTLPTSLSV